MAVSTQQVTRSSTEVDLCARPSQPKPVPTAERCTKPVTACGTSSTSYSQTLKHPRCTNRSNPPDPSWRAHTGTGT
jgi:hypothetical protein